MWQRTTPSSNRSRALSGVGVSPFLSSRNEENIRPRSRSTNFVPQEDAYLSRAYVNASCDPRVGNNQKGDDFWRKVGQGYKILCVGTEFESRSRTTKQLYIRFNKHIKVDLVVFNRYYLRVMQKQPSGVPQSEYTDMAAELYREGEGKPFRFKLCVSILHEVPKYCPFYSDSARELEPQLEAQSGGDSDADAEDDDDFLEEPHEILSTTGEDPSPEESEENDNSFVDATGGNGSAARTSLTRRASTSSSSSSAGGNVRNTIGTVMGSRLKRPLGSKAAKADRAKSLTAMATASAVKEMAANVASLVASYDRKNENEVKRVKMEETRSAVAMYMGMGMMQQAQEWAAKFAEDLTIYREPGVAPSPLPPQPQPSNEPVGNTAPTEEVSGTDSTRRRRVSSSTRRTSSSSTATTPRSNSSSGRHLRPGVNNSNRATTTTTTTTPPAPPGSPNLLADDSSEEEEDVIAAAPTPVPGPRGGPGATTGRRPPNEVRITPGDDDTASGRWPGSTRPSSSTRVWHNNNHDWLMGSQLTTAPPHQQSTQQREGTSAICGEDEEATQVGGEERRHDDEFGTAESTVILYGDG